MTMQLVTILDSAGRVVAHAEVSEGAGLFTGQVDLRAMPAALRQTFAEYEAIVNGQMFSLLDAIEGQVASLRPRVVFAGGQESTIEDLQIYPTTRRLSFRVATTADAPARSG